MLKPLKTYAKWVNEEFYPFYLSEHQNPRSRLMHYGATVVGTAGIAGAIAFGSPLLLLGIVAGYAAAFTGHTLFEDNKPATLKMPLASLISDYKMFFDKATGKLDDVMKGHGLDPTGNGTKNLPVLPYHVWRCQDMIPADKLEQARVQPERGETVATGLTSTLSRLGGRIKAAFRAAAEYKPEVAAPLSETKASFTEAAKDETKVAEPAPQPAQVKQAIPEPKSL